MDVNVLNMTAFSFDWRPSFLFNTIGHQLFQAGSGELGPVMKNVILSTVPQLHFSQVNVLFNEWLGRDTVW